MIKAVIFDIDGVLIDSFESNLKFFQDIFKTAGYKVPTKSDYKKCFHLSMVHTIKAMAKTDDAKELKRIEKIAHKTARHPELFKLPEHSDKVIEKLSKKYKLALVTSRIKIGVDSYLNFSKTKKYFKTVVHFGHYKNPKPHPEPLLVAAKKLKVLPSEAVYIGDSLTDIQAAKAAGMKIILYSKKKLPGADFRTSRFKDLTGLITKYK